MKHFFNKYEKNDLPLDTYADFPIDIYNNYEPEDDKNRKKKEKKLKKEKKQKEKNNQNPQTNSLSYQDIPLTKSRQMPNSTALEELEDLNEQNLKYYRSRTRRNRVIILALVVLLLASILGIVLYATMVYLQNNCFLYTHGNCNATYVVDGVEMSRFRTPNNLQGNRVLRAQFSIKIESRGDFNVRFRIDVFQYDELLENIIVYYPNRDLFYNGDDGYYYSSQPIKGGRTINLCRGVVLDNTYEETLNVDNFRLEFHTYFEPV